MFEPVDITLLRIRQNLDSGKLQEALEELRLLLIRQPENGRLLALSGRVEFRYLNLLTQAEESLRKAIRLAPDSTEAYLDYGELLLQLDKNTELIAVLNKALEVQGIARDKIFRLFGLVYEREKRWEDAYSNYVEAIRFTLDMEQLKLYKKDIERCQEKERST